MAEEIASADAFPAEFPYEDYLAGLTRQMASSFLYEDEKYLNYPFPGLFPKEVGSPVTCPPEQFKEGAFELFYAAAGQVMRMKLNEDRASPPRAAFGLLENPARKPINGFPAQTRPPVRAHQATGGWNRNQKVRGDGVRGGRQQSSPAMWGPPYQASSGMRAVFLGLSSRRESCGTGVFLPRRADSPADFRKRPACATVLLPARVVQALNLDLDELGIQPRLTGGFTLDHAAMAARGNAISAQRRSFCPQTESAEMRLPAEWTY